MAVPNETPWDLMNFVVRFPLGLVAGLAVTFYPMRLLGDWLGNAQWPAWIGIGIGFGMAAWWYGDRFWNALFGEDGAIRNNWF